MVLKAQVFMADLLTAFLVLLVMCSVFFMKSNETVKNSAEEYADFRKSVKLLQASEMLVSTYEKGFALRESNSVKHHELDVSRIRLDKSELLLEDYEVCLTVDSKSFHYGDCFHYPDKVKRFAVCGGELCVLELSAGDLL